VAGLCNGMSSNCKFDYIEAEFTGVLHVKKNFRVKEGFGNGFGNMGLSSMRLDIDTVRNVAPHLMQGTPANIVVPGEDSHK